MDAQRTRCRAVSILEAVSECCLVRNKHSKTHNSNTLFDEILPLLPDRVAMVRGQGDILQHDGQAGEERRDGEERGVARR